MNIKDDLYNEIEYHLLNDEQPSLYFNNLLKNNLIFRLFPFSMISGLVNINQSLVYHPEGTVWNHTMMVLDVAARKSFYSADKVAFMWAVLLHDIGKLITTKIRNGRITSYDHDIKGAYLVKNFFREFKRDRIFIEKVSRLVRWHMQFLFAIKELHHTETDRMLEECDIYEVALLAICDRLGRGGLTPKKIKEEEKNILLFIDSIYKVQ
jgi:putative nucleotidyltransferase with HDIG domain